MKNIPNEQNLLTLYKDQQFATKQNQDGEISLTFLSQSLNKARSYQVSL